MDNTIYSDTSDEKQNTIFVTEKFKISVWQAVTECSNLETQKDPLEAICNAILLRITIAYQVCIQTISFFK